MPKIGTIPDTYIMHSGPYRIAWVARPDGSGGTWTTSTRDGAVVRVDDVTFSTPVAAKASDLDRRMGPSRMTDDPVRIGSGQMLVGPEPGHYTLPAREEETK